MELMWDIKNTELKVFVPNKRNKSYKEFYLDRLNVYRKYSKLGCYVFKEHGKTKYVPSYCNMMLYYNYSDIEEILFFYPPSYYQRKHRRKFFMPLLKFNVRMNKCNIGGRFKEYNEYYKLQKENDKNINWQYYMAHEKELNKNQRNMKAMKLHSYIVDYNIETKETILYLISDTKTKYFSIVVDENDLKLFNKVLEYMALEEEIIDNYYNVPKDDCERNALAYYLHYGEDIHKVKDRKRKRLYSMKKYLE